MSGMLRNFEHTIFATRKFLLKDDFFDKKDIFFCGCKMSSNGAFCDGTHKDL